LFWDLSKETAISLSVKYLIEAQTEELREEAEKYR
jgi:hypothetical protein